jgi:hypothetical protein
MDIQRSMPEIRETVKFWYDSGIPVRLVADNVVCIRSQFF